MTSDQISRLEEACLWADSYSTAQVLLDHCPTYRNGRVVGVEWFRILGECWSACDSIGSSREEFRKILLLASGVQLQAMMTTEEREAWHKLPDEIEAWRGCEAQDDDGLSFSLCKDTAAKFPFLHRYKARSPTLITATIPKRKAVLKLGREESEIIAPIAKIIGRVALPGEAH